jgi:hypothetical protein
MRLRPFTKQEVEKIYKAMEQAMNEILGTKEDEAESIEGILIIGFKGDDTISTTNCGAITLRKLLLAFENLTAQFYIESQQEKLKYAE